MFIRVNDRDPVKHTAQASIKTTTLQALSGPQTRPIKPVRDELTRHLINNLQSDRTTQPRPAVLRRKPEEIDIISICKYKSRKRLLPENNMRIVW